MVRWSWAMILVWTEGGMGRVMKRVIVEDTFRGGRGCRENGRASQDDKGVARD